MGLIQTVLGLTAPKPDPQQAQAPAQPKRKLPQQLCRDPRVNKQLKTGGYCAVLNNANDNRYDAVLAAGQLLERDMVLVPAGAVQIEEFGVGAAGSKVVREEAFFVDKFPVTNEQFKHFLNEDGYRNAEFWPKQVWPLVSRVFIDTTGVPAPMNWESANYDPEKADHPVVGISWFEATAYANWVGKQLPTTIQWQRAATWWKPGCRFPWGERNDRRRLNSFGSGADDTVSVHEFKTSGTPAGVEQLAGNVWEWTQNFHMELLVDGETKPLDEPIAEIRGGAFDTYLAAQSTCNFRAAQPLMSRNNNVGFRCVASHELLALITSD